MQLAIIMSNRTVVFFIVYQYELNLLRIYKIRLLAIFSKIFYFLWNLKLCAHTKIFFFPFALFPANQRRKNCIGSYGKWFSCQLARGFLCHGPELKPLGYMDIEIQTYSYFYKSKYRRRPIR